jgi:DNA-binding NarL/FixJ family response regulator
MMRIAIADDHPMMRGALIMAAASSFGPAEFLESSCISELLAQLREAGTVDLVLLDLQMPGTDGFEGVCAVRANFPGLPVVVTSADDDPRLVFEALSFGAAGFIGKSTPRHEVVRALRQVAAGGVYAPVSLDRAAPQKSSAEIEFFQRVATLTPQQRRVLELLVTGKLNKEIAFELDIAETTVKAHVSSVLHKLKVYSRTQAVIMAQPLQLRANAAHPAHL